MGGKQKEPQVTLEDSLIEMKIQAKRMTRESNKAMKDSNSYMKKAEEALRKNNEEAAKMYLQSAASKRAESVNIQRMGLKMEFIGANMKNMQNNQAIMGSFDQMAKIVNYNNNPDFTQMANNMGNLQKCMDDMLINAKMMEEVMAQDTGADQTADNMLDALKGELAMKEQNKINEAALIQQKEMEFAEQMKKL